MAVIGYDRAVKCTYCGALRDEDQVSLEVVDHQVVVVCPDCKRAQLADGIHWCESCLANFGARVPATHSVTIWHAGGRLETVEVCGAHVASKSTPVNVSDFRHASSTGSTTAIIISERDRGTRNSR